VTRISDIELRKLKRGQPVVWVFRAGNTTTHHLAQVKLVLQASILLHVYFDEGLPKSRKWSIRTNQPLHEWRGYTGGEVWLERHPNDEQNV
jgi:hypothetical protein